ncbi:MAG: efflux RND transporter periplasmic adaptor subunit [Gammaproteobacteria bacterium]|nr:efflux RND transporter periplasmic adaptor subunit [Gammaproteobacteria bacterium]
MIFKRFLILLLLLGGIFGGIFYLKNQQAMQMQAQMAQPMPPTVIAATSVTLEQRQPSLRSVGSLVAVHGVQVSSETAGIVSEILFESGDQVKQGDPLIKLDATVDQAALTALRADQRLAEVEYKRSADLLPKKAVSRSDYDQAKAKLQSARARVEEQRAVVSRKTILAPFDGVLGIRQVNQGQYLNPGEGIVPLQSLDPIYVDYTLPERYFQQISIGRPVRVTVEALPDETFEAKVTAIDAALLEGTRSIKLRATLNNVQGTLRPGMFAEVHTIVGEDRAILTIPQTAISYNTYGSFVMVVAENEAGQLSVARRQVEPGSVKDGRAEIVQGLEAGEQVVRAGHNKLRPGQSVSIDNRVELDDDKVETQ